MYPPSSFYQPVAPSSGYYSHTLNSGTYPSTPPTSSPNGWVPALGNDLDGMPNPMPSPERHPFDTPHTDYMNSTPFMVSDPFGMPHWNVQQTSFVAYHGTTPRGPATPGFPPPTIDCDYSPRYEVQYQGSFPIPTTHAVNPSSDPRKHRTGHPISINARPDEKHQGPLSAYTIGSQSSNHRSQSATSSANALAGYEDHNSPQAQPSPLSGFVINEGNYGTTNGGRHDYVPLNNGSIRHIAYDSNSGNRIKDEVLTREEYMKIVLSGVIP